MIRLSRLVMIGLTTLGSLGIFVHESSAKLSQAQQYCQEEQEHDIATFGQALKRNSTDLDALLQLGYEQIKANKGQAAIATFQQALSLAIHDIEKIEVYRGLGEAYLVAQNTDLTEDTFLKGLRLELPSQPEEKLQGYRDFRVAMIHYHRCDWVSAIASFRDAYPFLEYRSNLQDAYFESLAHVYDWSELQDYFTEYHQALEGLELLGVGNQYAALLKEEDAIAVYQEFSQWFFARHDTPSVRPILEKHRFGEGLALGKHYEKAERVLLEVYQDWQDNPRAINFIPVNAVHLSLSTVWVHLKKFDSIESLWSQRYSEPSIRELKLGQFYLSVQSSEDTLDLARQRCEQSLQIRPSADAHQCLGDVAFKADQYQAAIASYQQAKTLGKTDVLEKLSNSYEKLKQYAQAIDATQRILELYPSGYRASSAYRKLAHFYVKQKQWQLAQEAYQRSYESSSSNDTVKVATAKSQLEYGGILIDQEEYDRAIAVCKSASEILPQSPRPLICLGDAYGCIPIMQLRIVR